jgi:hypothetical protein
MSLTIRAANCLLIAGKPVVATTDGGQHIRIIRARTRQGHREGKEINTGQWRKVVEMRPA